MIEIMKKTTVFIHNLTAGAEDFKNDLIARTIDLSGKASIILGGGSAAADKMGWIDLSGQDWMFLISLFGGLTLIIDRLIRLYFFIKQKRREERFNNNGRNNNDS